MHPPPGSGDQDERRTLQQLLGYFDGPAFMRRVKRVEEAYRVLLERLAAKRAENLSLVRLRVGQLAALAGSGDAVRNVLGDDSDLRLVQALHADLEPKLRLPLEPTRSERVLRGAVVELREAIEAFNRRWRKLVEEIDLAEINKLRDGYNRYYLLEKECALGGSLAIRRGFVRMESLTVAHLFDKFPLLRVPDVAR